MISSNGGDQHIPLSRDFSVFTLPRGGEGKGKGRVRVVQLYAYTCDYIGWIDDSSHNKTTATTTIIIIHRKKHMRARMGGGDGPVRKAGR